VIGETEIVIGGEVQDLAPLKTDDRSLLSFHLTETPVEALAPQLFQLRCN
jgi:hypothetical protein